MKVSISLWIIFLFLNSACITQDTYNFKKWHEIIPGDQRSDIYLPLLKDKVVGVIANQSSMIGKTHLIDFLLQSDIQIEKVFSPEHGFRGNAEAGALIDDNTDQKTGLKVISLYGSHKKPTSKDLKGIDILIFDLQDVGCRFYTYLATMTYAMEACAENGISFMVLDRPNPNGFYVDGPILEMKNKSFVGMHPVPIVHGMTAGEYALMVNGEKWLKEKIQCKLEIVEMIDYSHTDIVELAVKPSPNLPNLNAILLYPSLCLFEGTIVSIGRGTDKPFEIFGHPDYSVKEYTFKPRSIEGASLNPPYKGDLCYGTNLTDFYLKNPQYLGKINLDYILTMYNDLKRGDAFFNTYFIKLSGTQELEKQIITQRSAWDIKQSWKSGLDAYKKVRGKYLLYPDF